MWLNSHLKSPLKTKFKFFYWVGNINLARFVSPKKKRKKGEKRGEKKKTKTKKNTRNLKNTHFHRVIMGRFSGISITLFAVLVVTSIAKIDESFTPEQREFFDESVQNLTNALASGDYTMSDPSHVLGKRDSTARMVCEEVYRNLDDGIPFFQASGFSENLGGNDRRTPMFVQKVDFSSLIASTCDLTTTITFAQPVGLSRTIEVFFNVWLDDGPAVGAVSPGPGTYIGGGSVPGVVLPDGNSATVVQLSLTLPLGGAMSLFVGVYAEGSFPSYTVFIPTPFGPFPINVGAALQAALIGIGTQGPPSIGISDTEYLLYDPAAYAGTLPPPPSVSVESVLPGRALAFAASGVRITSPTE
jgi:hypothetical protein